MNKIVIIIFLIIFSGCSIANTPTSKVEAFLSRYQRLDGDISLAYDKLAGDENISNNDINRYREVIKRQYKNLSYEIKDEEIDGNTAIVTTEIKVYNYKKILDKYNKDDYIEEAYHDFITSELNNQKEKIVYTIEFELNSSKDGEWGLESLDLEEQEKLLGIN